MKKERWSLCTAVLAAVILCLTNFPAAIQANEEPEGAAHPSGVAAEILVSVPEGLAAADQPDDRAVKRSRPVKIDPRALKEKSTGEKIRLRLDLFPDVSLEAVVEREEVRGETDFSLMGHLTGKNHSTFIITVLDDVMVANIRTQEDGVYQIRYLGKGVHEVREIDEFEFAPSQTLEPDEMYPDQGDVNSSDMFEGMEADNGEVIDILVVYTPAARIAAGGSTAVQALVNLAVDESNQAFARSQIIPRLRLVYKGEIAYTESRSFDTDLTRLRTKADGYLDAVHTLRDTYGADVVSMLINDSAYCGMGYLMTTLSAGFESLAFSIVHWSCATGNYSFIHEIGHNLGCHHDRESTSGSGLYSFSHGSRFVGKSGQTYRTIMAYQPGTRIQNFSNPSVAYDGVATGVPVGQPNETNNALSINSAALTAANWRQTTVSLAPANPNGLTPGGVSPDGSVVVTSSPVTLRWNACAGADRYEVNTFYWSTSAGAWIQNATVNTTTNALSFTMSVPNTHYAWAVRSGNSSAWSAWSSYAYYVFSQACSYSISPNGASFGRNGGTGSVTVSTGLRCGWTAKSNVSWIKITSGASGSSTGTVVYSVARNNTKGTRSGTMTIAGRSFTVTQSAK